MEIKNLQPQLVFSIFDEITKVPRPSKKEEKIRQYLLDYAKKHGSQNRRGWKRSYEQTCHPRT